ncbi:glycine C-acetyltransferase [bacterium]|nr:glycine C-acetyltransferase [bacterium]
MGQLEKFLTDNLNELHEKNLYFELKELQGAAANRVTIGGKSYVQMSSNNYLGLATDPEMIKAAKEALDKYGAGTAAVRTITGTMDLHTELENHIAKFKHTEAALVLQSGYTANVGVVTGLMNKNDLIISDELNHASIIDGIRLTGASKYIYKHKDMEDLERGLKEAQEKGYGKILVVTDGVFSMDGDIAPLPNIVELKDKYGVMMMVDDAHSSGVLGKAGRGTVDHFNLNGKVEIQIGTLSKAIGVLGGYVAGSKDLRNWLINRCRPFLFSSSHPLSITAAALKAFQILEQQPERIEKLWSNARYFKKGLQDLGFDTGFSETPITPVIAGSPEKAKLLGKKLFENGVFATPIVFPTVPMDKCRVRTIVMATHTKEDLDLSLEAFKKVGKELGLI